MKNLFDTKAASEILARLEQLNPDAQKLWGKMEVAQMLFHCSEWLEISTGLKNPPRSCIGRLLGPLFKSGYYDEKPLEKTAPQTPVQSFFPH
jgi:hypothetical protein